MIGTHSVLYGYSICVSMIETYCIKMCTIFVYMHLCKSVDVL